MEYESVIVACTAPEHAGQTCEVRKGWGVLENDNGSLDIIVTFFDGPNVEDRARRYASGMNGIGSRTPRYLVASCDMHLTYPTRVALSVVR